MKQFFRVAVTAVKLWCITLFLLPASALISEAAAMDHRDEIELSRIGNSPVWVALHHKPGRGADAIASFNIPSANFAFINTIVLRAPADRVVEAVSSDFYLDGEILDDSVAMLVVNLLTQLLRVGIYQKMNFFPIAVLNISVGPPKSLLNKRRTGEKAVARAYEYVITELDIPVVTSAGNEGPQPGTMNPWTQARGAVAIGAADVDGRRVSRFSSRPMSYDAEKSYYFFIAHGENTIGALARGESKTPVMLEAEKEVDLAGAVGSEQIPYFSVRSGTSFAAGHASRLLRYVHQAVQILRAYASSVAHAQYPILPFVRAYIDTEIDETHPIFKTRLADKRVKYGGLMVNIDIDRKRQFFEFFAGNAIDLELRYSHRSAINFLKMIARPIPEASPVEGGLGFVSFAHGASFVRQARYSTLLRLLAKPGDDRLDGWLARAREVGDPLLFSGEEAEGVARYCDHYDLVLALSLKRQ